MALLATHKTVSGDSQRKLRDVTGRGARVRYVEEGEGPTLLLVHDHLSSALEWEDVIAKLASKFRVIAVDLPGHGESEKPSPDRFRYGFDLFADAMVDVVATLGVARMHLCGRGLGALVALTLASKHPSLVDRLILVAPSAYRSSHLWPAQAAAWPFIGSLYYKQMFGKALFRRHFHEQFADSRNVNAKRVDAQFALFDEPAAREAAHATQLALNDTRSIVARLGRVAAKTLVVCGRSDRFVPLAEGRRLARELDRARFDVLDCGHAPAEEVPDDFSEIAMRYLTEPVRETK